MRNWKKDLKLSIEKLINIPVIDLGDIVLRAVEYDDYRDMFEYGSDDEVTKMLNWDSYRTVQDAKDAVNNVFLTRPSKGTPSAYAIIHKEDNKMIGTCDFFRVDWEKESGEIGYCLNRDYWNRGYITKSCKAVIEFGFNYLGLNKIEIGHMKDNIGSKRVIEKCGFKYTGEEYHKALDVMLPKYELLK